MRVDAKSVIATLVALILFAVVSGRAEAGCNVRVSFSDTSCLTTNWSTDWWGNLTVKAKNTCHNHGAIIARVDIPKGASRSRARQ